MHCILLCSLELGLTVNDLGQYTIAFLVRCNPLLHIETFHPDG